MNNFLYAVLLVWVKALHLADTDCTVPDVLNAYVNKDDNCKDFTMTCQRGYRMRSLMSCRSGFWDFEDPVCEPVQCLDEPEIINGDLDIEITSRNFGDQYGFNCDRYFIKNGDKGTVTCTETGKWEANITCEDCFIRGQSYGFVFNKSYVDTEDECKQKCIETCTLAEYNNGRCFIFLPPVLFRSNQMSLPECIQKCNNLPKCLTMTYYGTFCGLYSGTLEAIQGLIIGGGFTDPSDIVAEKNTCPTIL